MRLQPLSSRVDGPPSLGGAYPHSRDLRDEMSRPGSAAWSDRSRSHRSMEIDPQPESKPTGRMGVGHLVD